MKPFFLVFIVSLLLAQTVNAAIFELQDGAVVIGEIIGLEDGEDLIVDTEHMSEVSLDWDAIVAIRETKVVSLQLYDGSMVTGRLKRVNGTVTIGEQDPIEIPASQVAAINPVSDGLWEALELYADFGSNIIRGNNRVTQVSLGGGFDYNEDGLELSVAALTLINEQVANDDARRTTLAADWTKFLPDSWNVIGLYRYESDQQLALDERQIVGISLGNRLINDRTNRLGLFAGLAVNSEQFSQFSTQESSEAFLGTRYKLRSGADIDAAIIYFSNLDQNNRYRVQVDATMTVELVDDFDLSITYYGRYDSQPLAQVKRSDYGLVFGFRWSN